MDIATDRGLDRSQARSTDQDAWQGQLRLAYAWQDNQTQVTHSQTVAPLKVQRPFYPEGNDVCHSVILHTAGGMVGGDRLASSLALTPQAMALVTTAAASKIYRSAQAESRHQVDITIAPGACLEWLPQDTIVFNGAIYHQNIHVELASGATWFGWDLVRFGRSARGEKFQAGRWRASTEIWRQGQPLWIDRQQLLGGSDLIRCQNGLKEYPVVGTLALVGQVVEPELMAQARAIPYPRQGEVGLTYLPMGLIGRYRGPSTTEAKQWFVALWSLLRPHYHHRSACLPRVWP